MAKRIEVWKVFRELENGRLQSVTPEHWGSTIRRVRADIPDLFVLSYKKGGFYKNHWPYFAYEERSRAYDDAEVFSSCFIDGCYKVMRCTTSAVYYCPVGISLRKLTTLGEFVWRTTLAGDLLLQTSLITGSLVGGVACRDLKIL